MPRNDLAYVSSTILNIQQPFLYSIAAMAHCRSTWNDLDVSQQDFIQSTLTRCKRLTELCPKNFSAMTQLLLAESARLHGEIREAMAHYDTAIADGTELGFPPVSALACDLSATFWQDLGRDFIANTYRREARNHYQCWGALQKVEQLNKTLSDREAGFLPKSSEDALTLAEFGRHLDRDTMIEVALAVGGKLRLDAVIDALIRLLLESTGADRGILFIKHDESLIAEAWGEVSTNGLQVTMQQTSASALPMAIIDKASATLEPVLISSVAQDPIFSKDLYIREAGIQSILCIPLLRQGVLVGVVYLENHLTDHAFSDDQIGLINVYRLASRYGDYQCSACTNFGAACHGAYYGVRTIPPAS